MAKELAGPQTLNTIPASQQQGLAHNYHALTNKSCTSGVIKKYNKKVCSYPYLEFINMKQTVETRLNCSKLPQD
jgi:hypothetical protein